jgi:pentatricopeptide repeat protein
VNLSIFYPHPRGTLLPWKITAALLALVLITIAALWNFRSRPYITAGWLWFLATLVPVIGLIQVGLQARADRYTYIPYIGLFIIIGWGADELIAKLQCRKLLFFICAVVLFLTLGIMTYFQTRLWHNSITLYRHASEAVKDNWWAYDFLGSALAEQGRLDGAITQLEESLRIYPENFDAQQSLAKAYFDSGRVDKAIALYQKMVGPLPEDLNAPINPDFAERVDIGEITEHYAKANIDLGIALLRKGQLDEAAGRFKLALRFMPYSATAHKYLGDIFTRQGRGDEAAKYYAIARRIDPNSVAEKQNCKTEQK